MLLLLNDFLAAFSNVGQTLSGCCSKHIQQAERTEKITATIRCP